MLFLPLSMRTDIRVRLASPSDRGQLSSLREALWPEASAQELAQELAAILAGKAFGSLPLVNFVAEAPDGTLQGFVEVGLRSHSDGCDPSHPVGYVEGWYVAPLRRRQGVGAALLRAAEDWARSQGCTEMASDTSIENHVSQRAHEALGFKPTERSVIYRKPL
jgi:aminoglycoside 6'-N-acetyltransferase I